MEMKEILENNKQVVAGVDCINKSIASLEESKKVLLDKIIAPCNFCPLDGVYRCEACQEANYDGFNKRDWF